MEETTTEEVIEKTPEELLAEKDKQITDLQKSLAGYANKDYNYKKLRDMTEEETKKLTEKELEVIKRTEKLEEEQQASKEKTVSEAKKSVLDELIGDDKDLREKAEFHYNRLSDKADTPAEIRAKMQDAIKLASNMGQVPNQIQRANAFYSGSPVNTQKVVETAEQREFRLRFGITDEDVKKYGNK